MVEERNCEMRSICPVVPSRAVFCQECHQRSELQAEQQHCGKQQGLLAALAIMRGRELVEVALQVTELVCVDSSSCTHKPLRPCSSPSDSLA